MRWGHQVRAQSWPIFHAEMAAILSFARVVQLAILDGQKSTISTIYTARILLLTPFCTVRPWKIQHLSGHFKRSGKIHTVARVLLYE